MVGFPEPEVNSEIGLLALWIIYGTGMIITCVGISSYGQNLQNSTYKGETVFCILICLMGLVFFSHLIGNMQVSSGFYLFLS